MKGVLTMKGSGCVRVTASGAFATIGSPNDTGAGQTQLSIRRSATIFVETTFVETMFAHSSTNTAIVAMQSFAKATGDKDGLDPARRALASGRAAERCRAASPALAKTRRRSALPHHRGSELMFETQVKVSIQRLGSDLFVACRRPAFLCLRRSQVPYRSTQQKSDCFPRFRPMRRDASRRGPYENCKWPTKCSSTRPIRRRPGWLFCAATASRNSTLNLRTASN
jgi:hypothetical protein